jgi:RNA polymerase sigma-70 factor (ECF subfamily)
MSGDSEDSHEPRPAAAFCTTRWSVVMLAGRAESVDAQVALETLCQAYWPPVYAFVRRRGHSPQEAEDLTQGFFERMLAGSYLSAADREKGRFRTFLITMLTRYLANEWDRSQRLKRGGGIRFVSLNEGEAEERAPIEPATDCTPETEYERRWAETVLERVLEQLEQEYGAADLAQRFSTLKVFLVDVKGALPFTQAAQQLGLSEAATKSAVHRLRARYRELLRQEIARTVGESNEVDAELRHLFAALAG